MISVVPILLAIALVVFFARTREHLADTPTMKPFNMANGYGPEENERIARLVPELHKQLFDAFKRLDGEKSDDAIYEDIRRFTGMAVYQFHSQVYSPSTTPITEEMIRNFVDKIQSPDSFPGIPEKLVKLLKIYYDVGAADGTLPPGSTAQNTSGSIDELSAKYKSQIAKYDRLVRQAIDQKDTSKIEEIRALNPAISKTLDEMITKVTYLKKETPELKKYRDQLTERLRQIQMDYNGLVKDTDTLETLRRIRQEESGEADRQLYWYMIAFLIIAFAIVAYLILYGKKETTATMASTVPTTPAFT